MAGSHGNRSVLEIKFVQCLRRDLRRAADAHECERTFRRQRSLGTARKRFADGAEAVNRAYGDRDAMSVKNNSVCAPGCTGSLAGGVVETRQDTFLIADLTRDYSGLVDRGHLLGRRLKLKRRHRPFGRKKHDGYERKRRY
jgi:hypothetical protein